MPSSNRDNSVQCRHQLDSAKIAALVKLLKDLPAAAPTLLKQEGIKPKEYKLIFRSAIESIRGVFSATGQEKKKFLSAILGRMKTVGAIKDWAFIGSANRQDYKVALKNGRLVAIEAKGCPDGNNMTIWERPTWAQEFIVWSQCPDSLQHNPGHGIWSGISTRLVPKMVVEKQPIDAFVFYDGRCGSAQRKCPKKFGINDGLRSSATDIPSVGDGKWMPPPTIYLFPKTIPHPVSNKNPAIHDLVSCQFADALLKTFNVPKTQKNALANWVKVEARAEASGSWVRIAVGFGLDNTMPAMEGKFKRLKRE